ncbi:hypothetical protein CFELI_06485 [Corynebacterium felinum]|nr:hypothetical protein CFELI_06485 [Corynebacterium felinum]
MFSLRLCVMNTLTHRRTVIILLISAFAVYFTMLYTTLPTLTVIAGGQSMFDLAPQNFRPESAQALLKSLGEAGRTYYLHRQLPLDFLYPLLAGSAYTLGIKALSDRLRWRHFVLSLLTLTPLAAGLLDYIENIAIVIILRSYPELPTTALAFGFYAGTAKQVFYSIGIGSFLILVIINAIRVLKNYRSTRSTSQSFESQDAPSGQESTQAAHRAPEEQTFPHDIHHPTGRHSLTPEIAGETNTEHSPSSPAHSVDEHTQPHDFKI